VPVKCPEGVRLSTFDAPLGPEFPKSDFFLCLKNRGSDGECDTDPSHCHDPRQPHAHPGNGSRCTSAVGHEISNADDRNVPDRGGVVHARGCDGHEGEMDGVRSGAPQKLPQLVGTATDGIKNGSVDVDGILFLMAIR